MKYLEKEEIINQIVVGKYFIYSEANKLFLYHEPDPQLLWEAQLAAKKYERLLLTNGSFLTEDASKEYLISEHLWSEQYEIKLEELQNNLQTLYSNKKLYKYQSSKLTTIEKAIEITIDEIKELTAIKNSMIIQTIGFQVKSFLYHYLIAFSLYDGETGCRLWNSFEDFENSEHVIDIETLTNRIFYLGLFNISQIREIARGDPWRGVWKISCKTGTSPFYTSYCTQMQKTLGYWSSIYDSVYEHPYAPIQSVIDDDDELDAWFEEQHAKSMADKEKNNKDTRVSHNKRIGDAAEVFVKSDNIVDAKKVYHELNSPDGLRKIRQRQEFLNKKQHAIEAEMPDVASALRTEQNRLWAEKVKRK